MRVEQGVELLPAGDGRAPRIGFRDVTAREKIAGMARHEYAAGANAPISLQLEHCRPVLDVGHGGEITCCMQILCEPIARRPSAPAFGGIWHKLPAKP